MQTDKRRQLGAVTRARLVDAMADALAMDQLVHSTRAGEVGWRPKRASIVASAAEAFREWSG